MNVRVSTGCGPTAGLSSAFSTAFFQLTLQSDGSWLVVDPTQPRPERLPDMLARHTDRWPQAAQIEPSTASLTLHVPCSLLLESVPTGTRLCGLAAQLLRDHALAFEKYRQYRGYTDCIQVQRETYALIAECAGSLKKHSAAHNAWRPSRRFWWHRVWWHIEKHLGDPKLCPGTISTDLGLSRSALYRHFSPQGGVTHYIQDRRLVAIRTVIEHARQPLDPTNLARTYGIPSASKLNRLFLNKFGHDIDDILSNKFR